MSKLLGPVSSLVLLPLVTAALAVCTGANAASLELFPYPPNDSFTGVSNNGTSAVAFGFDNIYYLDASRAETVISAWA